MRQNPIYVKFKKYHRIKYKKKFRGVLITDGNYGLQAENNTKILWKHLEMTRRTIKRYFKKQAFYWPNLSIYAPFFRKPLNARMGKGKGKLKYWFSPLKKGKVIFETATARKLFLKKILFKLTKKMPGKANVIKLLF